ncbi:hypothetical protein BAY59_24380 [Prauserella coralliicola]|nr:hypothetical protein BAY59_24380 [Prauserella coralliicola]
MTIATLVLWALALLCLGWTLGVLVERHLLSKIGGAQRQLAESTDAAQERQRLADDFEAGFLRHNPHLRDLVNTHRARHGLPPLDESGEVAQAPGGSDD